MSNAAQIVSGDLLYITSGCLARSIRKGETWTVIDIERDEGTSTMVIERAGRRIRLYSRRIPVREAFVAANTGDPTQRVRFRGRAPLLART